MTASHNKLEAMEMYCDAFRELVNDRVSWGSLSTPAELLRLNSENDWSFICVAMDILGDATTALQNFAQFGLDGPTRYDNVGERYLRLYGLLSAAYTQQQAAHKLYKLVNCPSPKLVRDKFIKLTLRTLRHQLASHSLDYMGSDRKPSGAAFVPVRMELRGHNCSVTENRGDASKEYDLQEALNQHCDALISVLDTIYEKSYKTFFKANKDKQLIHENKLGELRQVRDGAIVIHITSPNSDGTDKVLIISGRPKTGT